MVPSIFSRRSAPEPEAPEASSTSTRPTTLVGSAREKWRSRLDQDIAADSTSLPTLSLSGAHPGGLAQLYTEHPVRLSLLIREPIAATALSALVMGTSYTGVDLVGMALIVGAVVTISVVDLLRARRVS